MSTLRSIILTAVVCGGTMSAATATAQPQTNQTRSARFVEIANIDGYSGFFNLGQGTVRMVAILSPTCDACVNVFHEIEHIMDSTPTKRLRAYVVFVPIHEEDSSRLALMMAAKMNERRVSHFWDPNLAVANAFKSLTYDGEAATSACFVFDTNAALRDVPDPPALAMFPHSHEAGHDFDGERLGTRVDELLARFEARQRRGPAVDGE